MCTWYYAPCAAVFTPLSDSPQMAPISFSSHLGKFSTFLGKFEMRVHFWIMDPTSGLLFEWRLEPEVLWDAFLFIAKKPEDSFSSHLDRGRRTETAWRATNFAKQPKHGEKYFCLCLCKIFTLTFSLSLQLSLICKPCISQESMSTYTASVQHYIFGFQDPVRTYIYSWFKTLHISPC